MHLNPSIGLRGTSTGNPSSSWVRKPWFLADIPLSQPIEKPCLERTCHQNWWAIRRRDAHDQNLLDFPCPFRVYGNLFLTIPHNVQSIYHYEPSSTIIGHDQPRIMDFNHHEQSSTIINHFKKIYPSTYHISYAYIFLASFTIHHNTHPSHSIKIQPSTTRC